MLTPPSRMIAPNAWLPAVLESCLLAYLRVDHEGLDAFRPWRALRRWADDSDNHPRESFGRATSVETALAELLGEGSIDGLTPVIDLADASAEERRQLLLGFVDAVLTDLDQNYLPGPGKADGPGHWTNYRKRDLVLTTPLTVDLAEEMRHELSSVRDILVVVEPMNAAGAVDAPGAFDGLEY